MVQSKIKASNRSVYWIVACFAVLYGLISIVNHLLFRTYALDLGLYTNALFDYSHFSFNDSTVFKSAPQNLLADHFDVFLILISPLSYIFQNYTLLLVQIAAILFGSIGVLYFLRIKEIDERWAKAGMIYFLLHFSIFSAVSYDYHSNVVAACFVPWLFYFSEKRNLKAAWIFLVLILITKENMALWMFFVCSGMFFLKQRKRKFYFLGWMAVVSLVYFILITVYVIPALSNDNTFIQFKYSVLGNDYKSALKTIFIHPIKIFKTLFINNSTHSTGDYVKIESWLFFLFSGGIVFIFRPIFLWMLIPIFLQKFLNDQIQVWGINAQYSIEFAPILAIGIFSSGNYSLSPPLRNGLFKIIFISSLFCTIRLMDRTSSEMKRENVRIYQPAHWKSEMNVVAINKALRLIPNHSSVCAQANIQPHLAWRENAYSIPLIYNAEYVIYEKEKSSYPLNKAELNHFSDSLEHSNDWEVIFKEENVRLLQRK